MSTPHFLVHNCGDTVGIVTVENMEAGQALVGWVMDTDETITLRAIVAIPFGHKIALREHAVDDTVLKYGHDIGRVVAAIAKGGHVHVHNVKTMRAPTISPREVE